MIRIVLSLVVVLALVGPLVACGKAGPPHLPPGKTDKFPRTYPAK